MIAERFANNPHYREYEELLIQLHHMFCAGEEDSDEADALRDKMDAPGLRLSPEEADRVGGLSGDLYQLQDDEVFVVVEGEQAKEARSRIQKAMDDQNWPELLEALRHRPVDMADTFVAFQRFRAYAGLGHWLAASEFIFYCLRRVRSNRHALLLDYLDCMYRAGRSADALRQVTRITPDGVFDANWLLRYVGVLQEVSEKLPTAEKAEMFRYAATALGAIIARSDLDALVSPTTLVAIYGSYALCLDALGQHQEALSQLDIVKQINPNQDSWTRLFIHNIERKLAPLGDDLTEMISRSILDYINRATVYPVPDQELIRIAK